MAISSLAACGGQAGSEAGSGTESSGVVEETNGDSGDTSDNSGVVTLTIWAEEDSFDLLNAMIESFKTEYSKEATFDITLVAQSDDEAKTAILSDVHQAGDVFSFPDDQFSGLLASGILEPITDQDEIISGLIEGAADPGTYKDTLYAIPYTADNGYFLYYNTEYLSASDVQTMDGILAACEASGKKMTMDLSSGWYMYSFFGGTGLEMGINDDGLTNHCNWNTTEGAIKGTDIAESMINYVKNPAFVPEGDGTLLAGAQDGTVAAGISGTWNSMNFKNIWGDKYQACKLPTYTVAGQQVQMSSFKGYKLLGVNSYSKHKDWAMKLAKWMSNEQNQTLRFEMMNQGPANKAAASSDEVAQVPAIAAVIEQSQYATLQRVGGSYWNACTDFANALINGTYNSTPIQELLDTMVDGITQSAAN